MKSSPFSQRRLVWQDRQPGEPNHQRCRPRTVLASTEARNAAERFAWTAAGTRKLKGIEEEIEVYRLDPGSQRSYRQNGARSGALGW
jgi:hypothetical protein